MSEINILSIIGDISNVIATGLAFTSIIVSIKEQKNARKHEKNKNIREQKLFWYNEITLNDIIVSLNKFVDDTREKLEHCKNLKGEEYEEELKEIYNSISDQGRSLGARIYFLHTFSKSLAYKCDERLQQIIDSYSDIINEAIEKKYISSIKLYGIQKNKGEIFSILYSWANEFIEHDD